MSRRRVLMIHDRYGPPTGMGKVVQAMVETLDGAGYGVTLGTSEVTALPPADVSVTHIPVQRRLPGVVEHQLWVRQARRLARSHPGSIVHVHTPMLILEADVFTAHHLAQAAHAHGVRARGRALSGAARSVQHALDRRIDDFAYRSPLHPRAQMTFVSRFLATQYEQRYGRAADSVIPPAGPPWRPVTEEERAVARRRYGVPNGRLVVAHLGGDDPRKGFRDVFELARDPALFVLLAGRGTAGLQLPSGLGVGFVDPDDLLPAADVVAVLSRFDAAPVAVLEAIARDLPVVTTQSTGWAHDIEQFGCGAVVRPDGGDLGEKLRLAIATSADRRQAFTAAHGPSSLATPLLALYERVSQSTAR